MIEQRSVFNPFWETDVKEQEQLGTLRLVFGSLMHGEGGGYGVVGLRLAQALKEQPGVELVGRFSLDWDYRILVAVAYSWVIGPSFCPDLIWHTMVECKPLPPMLKPLYKLARYLWVPSEAVKETMLEAGVDTPILVSGYGINPRQYPFIDRENPDIRGDRPYRFFTWTDSLPTRKGTDDVMRAFHKLNLPNCELMVKTSQDKILYKTENANVRFVQGHLSWYELVQLMGRCDVMVYPSKGEGFGLMPLEAMATGLCTIAPQASGMAEFVRPRHNLVIPVMGTEKVITSSAAYECPQYGLKLDLDTMADQMRWCYEHRHDAYLMGKRASEYVHNNWTWQQAGERAAAILRPLGSWRDVPLAVASETPVGTKYAGWTVEGRKR